MQKSRSKKEKEPEPWIVAKQINSFIPKPAKNLPKPDALERASQDFSSEAYPAIGFIARRNKGKTTVLICVAKRLIGKNTKVMLFAPTANDDIAYIKFMEWMDEKGVPYTQYTSIYDGSTKPPTDRVKEFVQKIAEASKEKKAEASETVEDDEDKDPADVTEDDVCLKDCHLEGKEKKKPAKPKKIFPEYLVVFDDCAQELKARSIATLVKTARHAKIAVLLSTQNWKDVWPDTRTNMTNMLVFSGEPDDKLELISKETDTGLSFNTFQRLYKQATAERFGFLFIDRPNSELRHCFHIKFTPEDIDNASQN